MIKRQYVNFYFTLTLHLFFVGFSKAQGQLCSNYIASRSVSEVRIGTFNVQRFNVKSEKQRLRFTPDRAAILNPHDVKYIKPHDRFQGVVRSIMDMDSDFLIVTEIENGMKSFRVLLEEGLKYSYSGYLAPSNSFQRVGLLVKSDLDLKVHIRTHINLKALNPITGKEEKVFVRGLPLFFIFDGNTDQLLFAIMGVHFKSRMHRYNSHTKDFFSWGKRHIEILEASNIILNFAQEFPRVPLFVMGDLNTSITSSEFLSWKSLEFTNPFNEHFVDTDNMGDSTYVRFSKAGFLVEHSVLDHVLIFSGRSVDITQAQVYRYKDPEGKVLKLPQSKEDLNENPSDHYPIFVDVRVHD